MKRLVLIDGNALMHRAFHATPPLTTSKGELVNATYGFTLLLLKAIEDLKPEYIAVAWDMKAPTFRHVAFKDYKGKRGPSDETLTGQYDRVFEVLKAFSIPEYRLPGFEADDLIGALAVQAVKKSKDLEVMILTGDRDIMQLINHRVKVMMPKKTISDVGIYGEEEFIARFGFKPIQLIDYKALAGDASDNIPGVPGIGEVSATKLIQNYHDLDGVYQHLDEQADRLKKLLASGKQSAYQSQKLATIETNIPIKLDLKACQTHAFSQDQVVALFQELEFKSLINKIPGASPSLRDYEIAKQSNEIDRQVVARDEETGRKTAKLDQEVEEVLQKMTKIGVLVDVKFLNKFGEELKAKLVKIEADIYSKIGHQFNLNSPKQLSVVLFDELKLPVVKKTKTGRSTDEETLLYLKDSHPVVSLLLEYRELFKLVSTYVDALPKSVAEDGRIHSTFKVDGAATGRLSSINPNLQNIPIRGEIGSEMRKAFIAAPGKVLLGGDYSQNELRILAHLADDPGLKSAFQQGIDTHILTASRIFKIDPDKVTKEQRAVGKTMNFATLYGQGPHSLSKALGVDFATAKFYIDEYFAQFPKVKDWMQKTIEQAHKDGYVETIWGRRRYIPELQSNNRAFRSFGERAAINSPVQGSSADMIKQAMVEIDKKLIMKNVECKMILQIHDELLFECSPDAVEEAGNIIKDEMEQSLQISVPIVADIKIGPNWGEMKPLQI